MLSLVTACATTPVVRLDTGHGEPQEYRPTTSNRPVKVEADAFEESLTGLLLNAPLHLRAPQQGWLVRASYASNDADSRWRSLMSKSFGGICEPGQRRDNCLSLLDDVMGLSEWDKLGVALGLSLDPLRESISRAVEETLAPQLFFTVIATGLVTWVALAANPEPVFTKVAAVMTALMLVYLGVDTFLELVDASRELKSATDKATVIEELEQAGQRFAHRVGPRVARVMVLAVTVVVSYGMTGGAAALASRLPMLPNFPQAASVSASQLNLNLANVGQVSTVAVVGSTVMISLPGTAMAMAAQVMGGGPPTTGPTGQLHHPISKRIAKKLDEHATLRGHYTERDPRFITRAADKESHNGYQAWHRKVDEEVISWLGTYRNATPAEFEAYLRQIYSRPEMRARFPDGF